MEDLMMAALMSSQSSALAARATPPDLLLIVRSRLLVFSAALFALHRPGSEPQVRPVAAADRSLLLARFPVSAANPVHQLQALPTSGTLTRWLTLLIGQSLTDFTIWVQLFSYPHLNGYRLL